MDEVLPLDVIINILSRIPVKLLLQLRCLSKLWCNLIDHPSLPNMHIKQAQSLLQEPIILLLSDPTGKSKTTHVHLLKLGDCDNTLRASEKPITTFHHLNYNALEGSCNGLLCFANNHPEGVILLNPIRKYQFQLYRVTSFPSPLPELTKYGLGFDCSTNTYKVVRVFFQEFDYTSRSCKLGAQVCSLSFTNNNINNSWREIHKLPHYPVHGKALFACGALHWMVQPFFSASNHSDGTIVSFDIAKEEFYSTPHPNLEYYSKENCNLFHLVDLNGNLGMVDHSSDIKIEIWMLKIHEKRAWVKEYIIDIKAPSEMTDSGYVEVIGPWGNDGEILLTYWGNYVIYNPKAPKADMLRVCSEAFNSSSTIYSHRGSMISISNVMNV